MRLPKWDGHSRPPRSHVVGHRLLGPPVAVVVAFSDAAREFHRTFRESYDVVRTQHADRCAAVTLGSQPGSRGEG